MKTKKPLTAKQPLRARVRLAASTKPKPKKRLPLEKQPLPKLRREADKWFSRYVRLRDSTRHGDEWRGRCITCGRKGTVAYIDQGKVRFTPFWHNAHFIKREVWATRYEEENCNLSCQDCNYYKHPVD